MADQPATRTPPPTRRRGWIRLAALGVAGVVSALLAAASALAIGGLLYAESQFVRIPEEEIPHVGGPCLRKACNYLILGSDTRKGLSKAEQSVFGSPRTVEGERADTIILVHLDPRRQKAVVLHFPRDLWVSIPGRGMGKINSAFEGGPDLVAHTIRRLTGLRVNHFLGVSLAGFEGVVDALGGVPICVDRPMFDPLAGLNLPGAGCYDLDGKMALAFVRARHVEGDCIPDFSRIARQQQFLRAVLAKLLSPGVIFRLPSLITETARNLTLDERLKLPDVVYLANQLEGVGTGAVDFRVVPGTTGTVGPLSVVLPVQPDAGELFRRLRDGERLGDLGKGLPLTPPSPANVRVRVLDAASGGKATEVSGYLARAGFAVLDRQPAVELPVEGPAILFRPGAEDEALVVQRFLPGLDLARASRGILGAVDVGVVIGADYRGPGLPGEPAQTPAPAPPQEPCG